MAAMLSLFVDRCDTAAIAAGDDVRKAVAWLTNSMAAMADTAECMISCLHECQRPFRAEAQR